MLNSIQPGGSRRIIGFLRYSVVTEESVGHFARTRRAGFAEACAQVFDPRRLAARAALFEAITLPCFRQQATLGIPFELCVLVSPALPASWRDRLERSVADAPFVRLVEVAPDEQVAAVTERVSYADLPPTVTHVTTFRIDDDDCVSDDYMALLAAASNDANAGKVHSFNQGFYAGLDADDQFFMYPRANTNNAWGLAFLASASDGRTIFSLGRHSRIYEAAEVVINERPQAWIRSVHDAGDRFTVPPAGGRGWLSRRDAERIAAENFRFLDLARVEAAFRSARAADPLAA